MSVNERVKQLEIEACVALKKGNVDNADRVWRSMLIHARIEQGEQQKNMDYSIVKSMQNVLLFAARCHKDDLFVSWLKPTWEVVCQTPFYRALGDMVLAVAFVIGDRRLERALPNLQVMFKQYLRICRFYDFSTVDFMMEWLELTAQMTIRNVDRVSIVLVQCYLRMLYCCGDWELLRKHLWKYYFYMQVFAQEYGYEKTFIVYGMINFMEIIFYERALKVKNFDRKRAVVDMLLGGIRNWITNIAKVTKMEEVEIINLWKSYVLTCGQAKLQRRFINLY